MKKATNIVMLIAMIFAYIGVGLLVISTVLLFIFGSPACKDLIIEGLKNGIVHTSAGGTLEEQAQIAQVALIFAGAMTLFFALLSLPTAIVTTIARKKETMGLYVATLVLSVLTGMVLGIVGGILGLVTVNNPEPSKPQSSQQ